MTTTILSNGTFLIDDATRDQAEAFVAAASDRTPAHFEFVLEDGDRVEIPAGLSKLFADMLHGLANGPVSIQLTPEELTTTVAADMLGVSRPTLMRWINSGELPAHKVGTHTRLKTSDVITFTKHLQQRRRDAFAALRSWDEEFDSH